VTVQAVGDTGNSSGLSPSIQFEKKGLRVIYERSRYLTSNDESPIWTLERPQQEQCSMTLKFVTNHHPDERYWATSHNAFCNPSAEKREREHTRQWASQFIVGEPQQADVPNATPVEELKRMGYVGLYKEDSAEEK
jgi:hypothetical protein